jgi:hypothetical protein
MNAAGSSETIISTQQTTRCHTQETTVLTFTAVRTSNLEHCTPLLIAYRQRAIMLYSSSSGRVQEAVFSERGRGYLPSSKPL